MHVLVGGVLVPVLLLVSAACGTNGASKGADGVAGEGGRAGWEGTGGSAPPTGGVGGGPRGGTGGVSGAPGGAGGVAGEVGGGGTGGGAGGAGGCAAIPHGGSEETKGSLIGDPCFAEQLPPSQRWIADPSYWKLLDIEPGLWDERCWAYERAVPFELPPFQWDSCGPGCEKAPLDGDIGASGRTLRASFHTYRKEGKGMASVATAHEWKERIPGNRHLSLNLQRSLADGKIAYAIAVDVDVFEKTWSCHGYSHGPQFYLSHSHDGHGARWYGTWSDLKSEWLWQTPKALHTVNDDHCHRAHMEEGGRMFYFCGHHVLGRITPGSSELTTIQPRDTERWALRGAAEGGLVVWPSGRNFTEEYTDILGWANDHRGVRTILSVLHDANCEVAISDQHIAGFRVSFERPFGCGAAQPNPRLWISDRSSTFSGSESSVNVSPPLTDLDASLWKLVTWKGYVAAVLGLKQATDEDGHVRVVVARSSDWAVRWIDPPGGMAYDIGLDSEFLYIAPSEHGTADWMTTPEVYRYDLLKFEEIGSRE